jgi:hypothetical protein
VKFFWGVFLLVGLFWVWYDWLVKLLVEGEKSESRVSIY